MEQPENICPTGSCDLSKSPITAVLVDANGNLIKSSNVSTKIENLTNGSAKATKIEENETVQQKEVTLNPETTLRFQVRRMKPDDVNQVLDLWKMYELYEGKYTIQTFMTIDPDGFYVAEDLDTGRVLGCCGGAMAHSDTGFLGLYAVQPELQGRGIGLSMYKKVMQHFGDNNVGLYSLEKHLHTYRDKAGFRIQDQVQVVVYEAFREIDWSNLISQLQNVEVQQIQKHNLPAVVKFDESIVGHRRDKLLDLCLFEPESYGTVAMNKSTGQVLGYGHVRLDNANKLMCGPLYSASQPVAELLIQRMLRDVPFKYGGLTLMVPDCAPNGHLIPQKLDLPGLYWLPRLFTKHLPSAKFQNIYNIHSPNFYPF